MCDRNENPNYFDVFGFVGDVYEPDTERKGQQTKPNGGEKVEERTHTGAGMTSNDKGGGAKHTHAPATSRRGTNGEEELSFVRTDFLRF